jgi:hypothetical protein
MGWTVRAQTLFPALRTYPRELQLMPDYLVVGYPAESIVDSGERLGWDVVHAAAMYAADMIVVRGVAVEVSLCTAKLKLADDAAFGEGLKVAVDSAQADSRQPLADRLVDLVGSEVRAGPSELFEDDATLLGHPELLT